VRLRRPLIAAVVAGAVLLVLGRAFAFLHADYAWYAALGARRLWVESAVDTVLLHVLTFIPGAVFAFANFSAVRHSILSLVLPRRLANVEFAEAVPPRRLDTVAAGLALLVAAAATPAVPHWTTLALVRADVGFGESDPYHQLDLGYYTVWLPLEMQFHSWAWVIVLVTTLVVAALYALTPGLRWENGAIRMTAYVRRHLACLVALILLLLAWRARIASFTLLFEGSGADGAFTFADHRWLLPSYVSLSVAVVAATALFLWSAWNRHNAVSFATLSVVLLLWIGVFQLLPLVVRSPAAGTGTVHPREAPYAATREAFTQRAFELGDDGTPTEGEREGTGLTRTEAVRRLATLANVAPGAQAYVVVEGSGTAAAPSLASGLSRVAHAWVEQDRRLLFGDLPRDARILRIRDVGERLRRLAPVFAQGSRPSALFLADTLYWVTDLYTASNTYPLSQRFVVAGERRGYFRHAATAYTHGSTGAVTIVAVAAPDPIATAWRNRFPEILRPAGAMPEWTEQLTLEPAAAVPPTNESVDRAFRARVRELYLRMRAALSTSDLAAFGAAFDSLGRLLGGTDSLRRR
jgi:uncharacterized membrane protein (UPF0182 family)